RLNALLAVGTITDEIRRRIERDLDLDEERLRRNVRGIVADHEPEFCLETRSACSVHVERMLLERGERNDGQRFLVRGSKHDRRGDAVFVRLSPRTRADAPAIAGLQARKAVLGRGRNEIVALSARE